jgi:glycosyltransferase involved in cell wall biosynthesis
MCESDSDQSADNRQRQPETKLLIPSNDGQSPELSIVIPALNEEITIERFIEWCKQGIAAAKVDAEILIIDSSIDRTAEIAVAHGARVLKTPKRGLGRAYIEAIPFIRGRYVLMGDAVSSIIRSRLSEIRRSAST